MSMYEQNPAQSVTGAQNPTFGDPLLQIQFDSPEKKKDKNYGKRIITAIYRQQNNNTSSAFYGGRVVRWREVWDWVMGRQSTKEFLDYTGIDGNQSYVNVDTTPERIGPQFVETLVNSMAVNDEYPCVTAVDDGSMNEKEQERQDALYRMREVGNIDQMQQSAGIALEPPSAYVPDDELSAEVYFKLEAKMPKEIEAEIKLEKVMGDNEYNMLKRRLLRYFIGLNCAGTKIEKEEYGFINIRDSVPGNLIYNFIISDSGKKDLSYIGEVYSLKIRELRKKYGKSDSKPDGLDEKAIFEIAKSANRLNIANRFYYYWNDNYIYAADRPYDDYNIEVFDCEIKVFDTDYYVSKTDNFGKENIQPKKGIPQPTSDKAQVISKNKYTIYRGVWAVKADVMIYWGYPDLVIKPFMDISESLFSYTINIPNNDGDYVPSLFERSLSPLRTISLCELKIKQLIAAMAPAGVSYDVERARDIDLGNGNIIGVFDVLKIRNQTGVVLWSSLGLNPNETNERPPIEGLANAESIQQLTELNNIRTTKIQEVRSLLGVPLYRDGSDLPPRMGAAVVENQTTNSNNVTDFITNAFHQLMQETLYKVCLLQWDDDVIKKGRTDLMNTVYKVGVEMKPTAYEKQLIENNIATWSRTLDGNGNPLLSPKDVFRIRNIKNFKLQDLYLSNVVETNRRRAEDDKSKREQANIQAQQQTAMQSAQAEAKMQSDKIAAEKELAEYKALQDMKVAIVTGSFQIAAKGSDAQMPSWLMPILQQLVPNIQIPIAAENQQYQQQIQQNAIAQQAAMQQMQQQPDEEQQEGDQQGQPQQQPQMQQQ